MIIDKRQNMGYTSGMAAMETVSGAIRAEIRRQGISLLQLARRSGTDVGQLSRFMRDQRSITLDTADKLVAALDVTCRLVRRRKGK